MKKRVPALVLALALALTVPAWAAQDTPDNFVRSKTYAGQFSDLTPESTFYDNVAALYAYGCLLYTSTIPRDKRQSGMAS